MGASPASFTVPTREDMSRLQHDFRPPANVDYSVCFASGDNWSTVGAYNLEGKAAGTIDWFALAAGGLHLNTTAEVNEKLASKSGLLRP
jgi:hypothetical protein